FSSADAVDEARKNSAANRALPFTVSLLMGSGSKPEPWRVVKTKREGFPFDYGITARSRGSGGSGSGSSATTNIASEQSTLFQIVPGRSRSSAKAEMNNQIESSAFR